MLRDVAVQRIKDGLGFRTGTSFDATIVLRLQEAQRDLEKGKTLPPFLLEEDATLALVAGDHTVAKPADFLRSYDENPLHYTGSDSDIPVFLVRRLYPDAVLAQTDDEVVAVAPSVYVIRQDTIDFITPADINYTLTWSYYKSGVVLTSNVENVWLANAPEWLIGEAGYRIALDMRNKSGAALFDDMRTRARAAVFADQIAAEEADGPFVMGADL